MKAAGGTRHGKLARLISLAVIAIAIGIGIVLSLRSRDYPSTDDAAIDADVVHVAAAVGGRVIRIGVTENADVRKGDLLFQIDPLPYELAVRQAASALDVARAANQSQRRVIATQQSASQVAGSQIARAAENLGLAQRTVERLRPLAEKGYVPRQQYDQAVVAAQDAATSLRQAREQHAGARAAIDTDAGSAATIRASEAALAIARRALDDTMVRASHPGRVVGLTVATGEMVAPSQSMFTLIKSDEWFVMANFRETNLKHIAIGDCATVYSMLDRAHPIRGTVEGIGSGVLDDERVNLPRELPYVRALAELGARRAALSGADPPRQSAPGIDAAGCQRRRRGSPWQRVPIARRALDLRSAGRVAGALSRPARLCRAPRADLRADGAARAHLSDAGDRAHRLCRLLPEQARPHGQHPDQHRDAGADHADHRLHHAGRDGGGRPPLLARRQHDADLVRAAVPRLGQQAAAAGRQRSRSSSPMRSICSATRSAARSRRAGCFTPGCSSACPSPSRWWSTC